MQVVFVTFDWVNDTLPTLPVEILVLFTFKEPLAYTAMFHAGDELTVSFTKTCCMEESCFLCLLFSAVKDQQCWIDKGCLILSVSVSSFYLLQPSPFLFHTPLWPFIYLQYTFKIAYNLRCQWMTVWQEIDIFKLTCSVHSVGYTKFKRNSITSLF